MRKQLIARLSGLTLIVLAGGVLASALHAGGGGPACPNIVKPVICSNGKTYINQCYADRDHAKDCVPYGD